MTARDELLSRFAGPVAGLPLYVADLTLWYAWHKGRGTLPAAWQGYTLTEIAGALGSPAWLSAPPWRLSYAGLEISSETGPSERQTRYATGAGVLTARWSLGPDGDWWQTEYPIKRVDDLPAARAVMEALTYTLDVERWARLDAQAGVAGVVALELPRRPYSLLLHDFLGWSEGLMLLMGDGRPALLEMLDLLEQKMQGLVAQVAGLPGALVLAPDNLDGQFISPRVFANHMAESYRRSADTLHAAGKRLVVHLGGPGRRILGPLAAAGIDGVEGICGPPQSDATLEEARAAAGPGITLWGGIAQDYLLPEHEGSAFEEAVKAAARQAAGDGRMIVGVADRVPVGADVGRLQAIGELLARA